MDCQRNFQHWYARWLASEADYAVALVSTAVHDCIRVTYLKQCVRVELHSPYKALQLMPEAARSQRFSWTFQGFLKLRQVEQRAIRSVCGTQLTCCSSQLKELNQNDPGEVKQFAERLTLDLDRIVRFRVGFFNESLPALLRDEPGIRLAVLRMDGDTYASTMEPRADV